VLLPGDGECDTACDVSACSYDQGDCPVGGGGGGCSELCLEYQGREPSDTRVVSSYALGVGCICALHVMGVIIIAFSHFL
jgi:hypothetical protein